MAITTHTTVSIAKTLIWSHTRTATDRGGGSSLFDTSLLEHAIACTGINFSCSDSIISLRAADENSASPTAVVDIHPSSQARNGRLGRTVLCRTSSTLALYLQPDRVGGCISVDARAAVALSLIHI